MRSLLPPVAACALAALIAAGPAPAEDTEPPDALGESLDLFERGAELFFRGLMDEIGPELRQLQPRMREMADGLGPMIAGLVELIDEIDAYHPPEMLPNGDIILRRKDPAELQDAPELGEDIEI